MEAPVLDEDLIRMHSRNQNSSQVYTRPVALKCVRIGLRAPSGRVELDSHMPQKLDVRVITDQGEYEIVFEPLLPIRRPDTDAVFGDVFHGGAQVPGDLAFLEAILNVRFDPVLDGVAQLRLPVDEGDPRTGPEQLQGGDSRRVLPPTRALSRSARSRFPQLTTAEHPIQDGI